jgi:hypothetical protein
MKKAEGMFAFAAEVVTHLTHSSIRSVYAVTSPA